MIMAEIENEHGQTGRAKEAAHMEALLNVGQRRSLTIALRRVEMAVWRLEDRITHGKPPDLALTRFVNFPDAQRSEALLQLIKQVREEVAALAKAYHLEASEEDFLHNVTGEFTLLWADLEDTRPTKLRRYGAVHPRANEVLGPPIQHLIELMLAINDVAKGKEHTIHNRGQMSETGER
jgi:hypothetical protein